MHYRATPFDIYTDSYDQSIDAIVAVGMGFRSHTSFQDEEQARQAALLPGAEALPTGEASSLVKVVNGEAACRSG